MHRGAIWYCADVVGPAVCERPELPAPPVVLAVTEPPTDPAPPVLDADDQTNDIEIVQTLALDDAIDESPEPPEVPVPHVAHVAHVAHVLESVAPVPESVAPPAPDDPFAMLVAVLEDVARVAGADDPMLATLACLLGRTRLDASAPEAHGVLRAQALAWQGILRGESEDFGACGGAMLDEWCAALIADILGQNVRADGLKRELRRRGVAAFGLVEQAA
jgi:hypothetical protein